jgi:hypothetical protein
MCARVQDGLGRQARLDAAQDFAMLALQQPQRAWPVDWRTDRLELLADVGEHRAQDWIAGLLGDGTVQPHLQALPIGWFTWRHYLLVQLGDDAAHAPHVATSGQRRALDGVALEECPQLTTVEHIGDHCARPMRHRPCAPFCII